MISVIIPLRSIPSEFNVVQERVRSAQLEYEVIYVCDGIRPMIELRKNEQIVYTKKRGRGHAIIAGLAVARGEFMVINHADTVLPHRWDAAITSALADPLVTGGGFSLRFSPTTRYLKGLEVLSRVLFFINSELWGDRSLFMRRELLEKNVEKIDVPIMEDVIISRCMKKQGRVILLPEAVTTSGSKFHDRGVVKHTLRIMFCRTLYTIKIPSNIIYSCYYGRSKR